ncbi:cobalt ECF transporter T component CbiQ [uncultured Ruminococcus sp.]|uniref:cobalt ECF transporter T component CbiQ n=1 Tax=uncultured Ruminococcus sp. TaxID=165186 RepID=UPI0026399913|nr:cobalt ECF transporter T component CbiQ [uncultured Ruminococcus sp.]
MKHVHHHSHSHGERILIDQIAYASSLRKVSPFLKIFVSLYSLVLCLVSKTYLVSILILICMLLAMTAVGKTRWHHVMQLMKIPLTFIVLGSVMVLIQITRTPQDMLYALTLGHWHIGITSASLDQFGHLFVQCLAAVSCMYFLSVTTPMTELFTALRRMHVPAFLVEIMELVYRYIFVLMEISSQIRNAQECRLGYSTLKTGFYSTGQLISNLFIRAYRQAERTYMAMESRGYTGDLTTLGLAYETKPQLLIGSVVYGVIMTVVVIALKIYNM